MLNNSVLWILSLHYTKIMQFVDRSRLWLSCLGHLVFLLPKTFKLFGLQIFWLWAYLIMGDQGYSRNVQCTLNLLPTFLLLSLNQYLCWWTINTRGYHPPSSQCFGSSLHGSINIFFYQNLQFLNHVIIIKTKVLLPQSQVTLNFSSLNHRWN